MIILTAVLLFIGSLRISLKYTIGMRVVCALIGLWWMLLPSAGETWVLDYGNTLQKDIESWVGSGHFRDVSEESRALTIVIGWTLFVTSVQMLAIQLRTVFLFGIVTVVYLLCMELLNGIHSPGGMIRTVCCFLLLQSLLQLPRLLGIVEESIASKKPHVNWAGTAVAIVLMTTFTTTSIASAIPAKSGDSEVLTSIWDKVSEWASSKPDRNAAATFATTGYDPAGRDMGAPLVQSNAVYFTATSPTPAYWRGQSRSIYDGRSWQRAGAAFEAYEYISTNGRIREEEIEENPYFRLVKQTITLQEPAKGGSDIFAGGVPLRLSFNDVNGDGTTNENHLSGHDKNGSSLYIWSDPSSGNLRFDDKQLTEPVQNYSMDVLLPVQDLTVLRKAKGEDPASVRKTDLQLPSSLPKRVQDLAASITSGTNNRYDAVMSVSRYLKTNYTYTLNTRVPGIDKDFVDDFLFVTKKGYCNHFSTAMVILLRSEGIPARYVQGFAPGERDEQQSGKYTVTQADAHSWVEVYFPGAGWFPFEATPGFEMAPEEQAVSTVDKPEAGISKTSGFQKTASDWIDVLRTWIAGGVQPHVLAWTAAVMLLLTAVVVAGRTYGPALRLRLRLIWPRRAFPDRDRLLHIGAPVWDLLAQRYGKRESGLTLREYIAALPVMDDAVRDEVRRFAADWEALVYGPAGPSRGESTAFLQRCLRIAKFL
nr:transglutaminase domain-containing protein [Paenibacillus sp. Marseille-Q4541]